MHTHHGSFWSPRMRRSTSLPGHATRLLLVMGLALSSTASHAGDTTAAQQLARWRAAAEAPPQAERGRVFFGSRHGGEWSCASCHGTPPTAAGKHATTGRAIDPMAPAFNPQAFTSTTMIDKWFRRNCKDVLSRECTAQEKADVLAYLISLQP